MEIGTDSADIITVFDNINFWGDYGRALKEITRVLKESGFVYIINGYPEVGTKWHDFVKFKNAEEYRNLLLANGITVEKIEIENHTILVKGKKAHAEK